MRRLAWSACLFAACGYRPDQSFRTPYGVLVIVVVAVPLVIAFLLGLFAFQRARPLIYRCRRCDGAFRRAAHLGFPETCSGCGAADWNEPRRGG
jgi:hypothetical protein